MSRLSNLQILRALAALFVVMSHAVFETVRMAGDLGKPVLFHESALWTAAVDVFFVMSGFILLSTSFESFGRPGAARQFFMRRLVRAVPLYWLLTTVVLVGGLLVPRLINVPITDPLHVIASYLFWPYPRGAGELRPVLALGWTMNMEFFFYAVMALALLLPLRWGVAAASAVLVGVVAAAQSGLARSDALQFWGSAMSLDFVVGFAIAILYRRGLRLSPALAAAISVAALVAILASASTDSTRLDWFVTISLPSAALVAAAVLAPQVDTSGRLARFGVLVGDACYSTYLLQAFVLRPAAVAWVAIVGDRLSLWAYVGVATFAAMGAGLACFLLLEKPLTAVLNRRLRAWEQRDEMRREARRAAAQPAE